MTGHVLDEAGVMGGVRGGEMSWVKQAEEVT